MKTYISIVLVTVSLVVGSAVWSTKAWSRDAASAIDVPDLNKSTKAELFLGVIDRLIEQGKYKAALAFLDDYQRESKATPVYLKLRGDALIGIGRYEEALGVFEMLTQTSAAAEGHNGAGKVLALQKRWAEAELSFARAVELMPSNTNFLNNLAFAKLHLDRGKIASAEFDLRQALELDPDSQQIRNNLILALVLAGNVESAKAMIDGIGNSSERAQVIKFTQSWAAN